MNITMLHHLGVPCLTTIKPSADAIQGKEEIVFLNPDALVRYEPNGATVTPPMLYASYLKLDKEMAEIIRQRKFDLRGMPLHLVDLLKENTVILDHEPESGSYLELEVATQGLPTQVLLDMTSACNCHCQTCYHALDLKGYTPSLSDIMERISKLRELGVGLFEITGGEPFLQPEIFTILKNLHEIGLLFYVVTNGEFLSDITVENLQVLKRGLGLGISLDGVEEIHDQMRQNKGLYSKLVNGLEHLYRHGIKFYLISTINEINCQSVPKMIKLAEKYQTTLHIRPTIRTGSAISNNLGQIDLRTKLSPFLKHPNVRNGLLGTKHVIPCSEFYGCGIRKRISVDSHGFLYPCVMDRTRHVGEIRNFTQESLVKALTSETKYFLGLHSDCRKCKYNEKQENPLCGGFCRFSFAYKAKLT